ncbi:MAG: acyclic terpene utilization AtuA family protein [Hyphomicrobium sp.]
MAGGDRNLDFMLDVAKEVFAELGIKDAKVAVIGAEIDPETIIKELKASALRATGLGPELDETALRESTIVGQMGIHPLMTALESGAQYIFAGRSCDIALFASDMIRRGIDAGLAYHVGHVLECGALACDPGSPSDCLVAEVYDDGTATFVAPNPNRRCTPYSIAAHSLYEESHPQLQFYPEGILAMENTEFFAHDHRTAGIKGSRFIRAGKPWPWSIKLEGARRLGARKVSLLHIDPADLDKVPSDVLVYGRNGIQAAPVFPGERELGIIIETTAKTQDAAEDLASVLTHYLIHYGYAGRKATAGNIAYPLSPNLVSFRRPDGTYGAIVPSGTRDPVFFENYAKIKAAVIELVEAEFPEALKDASYRNHRCRRDRSGDPDPHRGPRSQGAGRQACRRRRPDHLPADPAAGLADRARCARRLRMDALPPPAERGRDQERHVPDRLLRRDRCDLDQDRRCPARLRRHRRDRLHRQSRRSYPIADPRRAGRRPAGRRASAARDGRGDPVQGRRHQPADLRRHLHLRRKLRDRAELERLHP